MLLLPTNLEDRLDMKLSILALLTLTLLIGGCLIGPEANEAKNVEKGIKGNQNVTTNVTPGNQSVEELKGRIREAIVEELERGSREGGK